MDRRNFLALVGTAAFTPFATIAELLIQNQLFDRGIKENRQTRVPIPGLRVRIRPPQLCCAHQLIAINDEHCGNGCGRHSGPSILVGRAKAKHAPRGELLAAHRRPPCDSMMERLIRSPMPVP
jgi:hypothetical protein